MNKKIIILLIILLMSSFTHINGETIENKETTSEKYDYIIITSNYLKTSVKDLKEWRELQGLNVKIVTGYRDPEGIRDFLKTNHESWDIEYVLIVGSYKTIPMKKCYTDKDHTKENSIPTDHYYAELTHKWDLDNDGYYGEFNDDIINNTDLIPEISVGRIPFDRHLKVKSFCKKIIEYEKDNGAWKKKALFLAGIQEYIPVFIDGAFFAEKLQNEILKNYGFNCTNLYETGGLKPTNYTYDLPLNHVNTLIKLRQGFGFVSIMGKGTHRTARRYMWVKDNGNDIPDKDEIKLWPIYIFLHSFDKFFLKTDKPSVVYSFTCFTAHPKILNLCSSLLDSTAIIFMGPAVGNRGGWQLKYNFTKYFSSTSMRLGDAFFTAKTDYLNSDGGLDNLFYFYDETSIRWTVLTTGFYGDPATLKFLPPIL